MKMLRTITLHTYVALGMLFFIAAPAIALASDFVPLSPLPGLTNAEYGDIKEYINAVYGFAIGAASVLAVIMIIYHGIMYMFKEALPEKANELVGVRDAVMGLILLVISYLALYVINPQILDLNALNSSLQGGGPSAPSTGPTNTEVIPGRGSPIIWETPP